MIKKLKNAFISIFIILILSSCGYNTFNYFFPANDVEQRIKGLTELQDIEITEPQYDVLVLTDIHFESFVKDFDQKGFFQYLDKNPNFKFCLILGDVVNLGTESEYQQYKKFTDRIQNEYNIPVFTSIGNHDLYHNGWEFWKKYVYPYVTLYRFKTENFSWYCIDTGTGNIGKTQYELLSDYMLKDDNKKVVFTHYPIFNDKFIFEMQDSTEVNLLFSLFAKSKTKLILNGHVHESLSHENKYFTEKSVSSLLHDNSIGIIHVDEEKETISFEELSYK